MKNIKGHICTNIKKGIGSFLIIDFSESNEKYPPKDIFELWVYCCDWYIYNFETEFSHSEEEEEVISLKCSILKTLQIMDFIISENEATLRFNNNISLIMTPYEDSDSEMCILYKNGQHISSLKM